MQKCETGHDLTPPTSSNDTTKESLTDVVKSF